MDLPVSTSLGPPITTTTTLATTPIFNDYLISNNSQILQQSALNLTELLPCYLVNNLTRDTEEQCKFITDNDCLEEEGTIDYVYLVYCEMGQELRYPAIGLIIFLVIILFLNLSSVADEFLCPSLLTVAKNLRMSDSLAGVTLLAFGNGCPDIFSSVAAASSGRPKLIVGELLGAGIFCTSIVAGLVFITTEFKPDRKPLLRDGFFYSLSVCLIWYYCWQRSITFYGSLAFIIIYVIYLVFALGDQFIQTRLSGDYLIAEAQARADQGKTDKKNRGPIVDENFFIWRRGSHGIVAEVLSQQKQQLQQLATLAHTSLEMQLVKNLPSINNNSNDNSNDLQLNQKALSYPPEPSDSKTETTVVVAKLKAFNENTISGRFNDINDNNNNNNIRDNGNSNSKNTYPIIRVYDKHQQHQKVVQSKPVKSNEQSSSINRFTLEEWDQFMSHMNPIDLDYWNETNLIGKITQIIRAPLLFLTILTVPVVDLDKPKHNWCRLLNSLQCFVIPTAAVLLLIDWDPVATKTSSMANAHQVVLSVTSASILDQSSTLFEDELSVNANELNDDGNQMVNNINDWLVGPSLKLIMLLPGLLLSIFIFRSSEPFRAPKYHAVFAYFGFAMSVCWIYLLATEIISLLKTIGIIFSMTDTAIGLGVLAWGNSLGDIVANLSLAEAGYPRMALGASIGAPLLNLLLGFGLSFSLNLKPGQESMVEYTPTVVLLCSTLIIILISIMLSTLIPGDRSRKPFGYVLIVGYLIYFVLAVCLEYGLLFGSDIVQQTNKT